MSRIDNLTGVRAFAACWVVLYHLQTDLRRSVWLGSWVNSGSLGVDIFFALSGFVLSLVYAPRLQKFTLPWYRAFLLRRFAKIYPMHLITFLGMVSLLALGRHFHYQFHSTEENTAWSAFCNVFMLHALGFTHGLSWNIFSWSVSAEWFAYSVLLTPMLLVLRRWAPLPLLGFGFAMWTAYLLLCHNVLHSSPVLTYFGALRIMPEFLCGYVLYRLLPYIKITGDLLTAIGLVVIGTVACFPTQVFWFLMPGVMMLLAGAHKRGRLTDLAFGNRLSIVIGEASYSIYLLQLFTVILGNFLLRKIHLQFPGSTAMSEALCFVLMLGSGIACFFWVEEPVRRKILEVASVTSTGAKRAGPPPAASLQVDTEVSSTIS